jgi:uncharacterized protein (DUF1800 family)
MADPATRADVAHLFGRAAFGATERDLDLWTGQEYATVVDALFPPDPALAIVGPDDATYAQLATTRGNTNVRQAQAWWMERMRTAAWPLIERMTLFWHDHFATALDGPPFVDHLVMQNQTIRQHATGDLKALLNAITIDAATLHWLDGVNNRVNAINENYGREFFELFTLGTIPQVYTETDIKQAARAFTGWTVNPTTQLGQYQAARHDTGSKTVLGRTWTDKGADDYKEVTEAAIAQAAFRYFIAYKLVLNFGYVPTVTNLLLRQDPLINKVRDALVQNANTGAFNIAPAVKAMLKATEWRRAYQTPGAMGVRQPIECTVHAAKILGVKLDAQANNALIQDHINAASKAGQALFQPPNVGGWPAGKKWLAHTTNLARYESVNRAWYRWSLQNANTRTALPASADFSAWTAFMGLDSLRNNTLTQVVSYLTDPRTPAAEATRQQNVFVLLGTSPDWQVM